MAKKLRPLEPRNLALVADHELESAWRVESLDSNGAGYIAIFPSQSAETTTMRSSAAPATRFGLPDQRRSDSSACLAAMSTSRGCQGLAM
jgi:hypothetical protein